MGQEEGAIRLTHHERRELQEVARSSDRPSRAGVRATVILMSADGSSAKAIARVLGVGLRTVRRLRSGWRRESLGALFDGWRPGRPPRADKAYLKLLYQVVRTDPRKLGYCFAHWTAPRLAEYLKLQTGVSLCDDWVRRLLKVRGFVWRKTKLTIRNLQDTRGKKGGSRTPLEASEGEFTTGSDFRVMVRGRGALRSSPRHHLRLSASRAASADRNARKEPPGRGLRGFPLS